MEIMVGKIEIKKWFVDRRKVRTCESREGGILALNPPGTG